MELADGCYLLRSNLTDVDASTLWRRYIQLTEAEWAFRITKVKLEIRPICHQEEDRVRAHILVHFLAYPRRDQKCVPFLVLTHRKGRNQKSTAALAEADHW